MSKPLTEYEEFDEIAVLRRDDLKKVNERIREGWFVIKIDKMWNQSKSFHYKQYTLGKVI